MSQQLIDRFEEKCIALRDGKFIMSKDRIASILRLLASNEDMIELIKACNKHFNYNAELRQCKGGSIKGKQFKLPTQAEKVVALVTGLLYDFDRKPNEFNLFLSENFVGENPTEQFKQFYDAIIIPYKDNMITLLKQDASRPSFGDDEEKPLLISDSIKEQLFPLIDALTTSILSASIPETKYQECVTVLEGFYYAIETADERLVRAMWLGAKNTILGCHVGEAYIRSIDKVFNSYL